MRKVFLGLLLLCLLSACNLGSQATVIAPTPDVVATQVAQTLTAAPTRAGNQPLLAATTQAPAKPTTAPATKTAATTAAPVTASPTPTQPPSPTPSATVTASPVPGDPKTALGAPAWKDTFQKASSWGLDTAYDDGHTRVSIAPGKIVLSSKDASGWHGWRMLTTKIQNFYLEATFTPLACSGSDTYGLVFRASSSAKGYWLKVTCDGRYGLDAGDINEAAEVIKLKANPLIKSGSNQTNRIGVMAKGNKLSLYANGKLLEEITDSNFTGTGVFGYFISGYKTVNFTYESSEIAYWNLP